MISAQFIGVMLSLMDIQSHQYMLNVWVQQGQHTVIIMMFMHFTLSSEILRLENTRTLKDERDAIVYIVMK